MDIKGKIFCLKNAYRATFDIHIYQHEYNRKIRNLEQSLNELELYLDNIDFSKSK